MESQAVSPGSVERLLACSAGYEGFAVLFRHPDARTQAWLDSKEHRFWLEALELAANNRAVAAIARRLADALDRVSLAEWKTECDRVFGYSVQSAAPAYELEYGLEHSHRQPQELGDIAAFYQAFGLTISAQAHERIDFVATECEFLHFLCYKQAVALDEDKPEQAGVCEAAVRQFLADHLGRWGMAFSQKLSRCSDAEVLRLGAELLMEWLRFECARMQVPEGALDLSVRSPKEKDDVGCASCELRSASEDRV